MWQFASHKSVFFLLYRRVVRRQPRSKSAKAQLSELVGVGARAAQPEGRNKG